jgi:elongation factor Ts
MTEITAAAVKELRERTGAGMMDCKKALVEAQGDMESAVDWLRKKGLAAAAKKSSRVAAEGLIAVSLSGTKAAIVEVNAETDFVARNDHFQSLTKKISDVALKCQGDVNAIKNTALEDGKTVQESLTNLIAVIGENMNLRRSAYISIPSGVVTSYIHNAISPGMGRVGVLVALESTSDNHEALEKTAKSIAMHIAASHPQALSVESLDPAVIERERAIFKEQAIASGKPAEFADKMVEGRLRKFYEESILLEQIYLIDDTKRRVAQVVEDLGKTLGVSVRLVQFIHFKLGDGIEKQETDFASEVAQMAR